MSRATMALSLSLCMLLASQSNAEGLLGRIFGPGKQQQSAPVQQPAKQPAAPQPDCPDGKCPLVKPEPGVPTDRAYAANTVYLSKLDSEIDLLSDPVRQLSNDSDRLDQVIEATIRVTVAGVCGSGTIVGRDADGAAIVLTNAHVAGTTKGRVINLERWNVDGTSERATGQLISAGYGKGMSIDFALLKCVATFAKNVRPIPLADRYPNADGTTTYGCPRCEWPSMQVLRFSNREKQILTWKPEAIGGRSGSSLVDYTVDGPRVVGLLTWGGGGEGLGQSTPFLIQAMRGRLPTALEPLPIGIREMPYHATDEAIVDLRSAKEAFFLVDETIAPTIAPADESIVGRITEDSIRDRIKPNPDSPLIPSAPGRSRPILEGLRAMGRTILFALIALAAGLAVGYAYGKR